MPLYVRKINPDAYREPVWATNLGGFVQSLEDGKYYFVEPPELYPEFKVGDQMPQGWSIFEANDAARAELAMLSRAIFRAVVESEPAPELCLA